MDNLKRIPPAKITLILLLILTAFGCGKNQNSFLPNTQVNITLVPYELNFIEISGNSIVFQGYGYNGNGIILSCADPNLSQYYAYDATCPYEKDYSGVITVIPVKNYSTPPNRIFSSSFFGTCNKCGSVFNLMGGGNPTSGPATHYLQNYNVLTGNQSITITN